MLSLRCGVSSNTLPSFVSPGPFSARVIASGDSTCREREGGGRGRGRGRERGRVGERERKFSNDNLRVPLFSSKFSPTERVCPDQARATSVIFVVSTSS